MRLHLTTEIVTKKHDTVDLLMGKKAKFSFAQQVGRAVTENVKKIQDGEFDEPDERGRFEIGTLRAIRVDFEGEY